MKQFWEPLPHQSHKDHQASYPAALKAAQSAFISAMIDSNIPSTTISTLQSHALLQPHLCSAMVSQIFSRKRLTPSVTCSVPQGTALEPILFLIYMLCSLLGKCSEIMTSTFTATLTIPMFKLTVNRTPSPDTQRCQMGLKSGPFAGQSCSSPPISTNRFCMDLALCTWALSC